MLLSRAPARAAGARRREGGARRSAVVVSSFGSAFLRLMSSQGQAEAAGLERTELGLQPPAAPTCHPFRVCTFNILADGLAQSGDFVKVPISCLQWEHRLPLILHEVRAANADIICLQELNHFDVLASVLVPEGYSCFFRAKQPSPALKFGFPADGIALFYRHSRFSCTAEPAGHCFASMDGHPAAQGFVTALLHDKQAGQHILVAATHLKAKAGADNEQTRVHQACQLLQELQHMQERHMQLQQQQQVPSSSGGNGRHAPVQPPAVLLCGDFNTTPDSDTVRTIREHELGLRSIWDVPWSSSSSSSSSNGHASHASSNGNGSTPHANGTKPAAPAAASGAGGNGRHPPGADCRSGGAAAAAAIAAAGVADAAAADAAAAAGVGPPAAAAGAAAGAGAGAGAQPPPPGSEFTTWKFRSSGVAKRTIDYIWYSGAALAPTSRWRMLSEAEIGPQGLPNSAYPSDHMAVTAQFAWLRE